MINARTLPGRDVQGILSSLDGLERMHPELAGPCAYYREILPVLKQAEGAIPEWPVETGHERSFQEKIDEGTPVLRGEELPFPIPQTRELFLQVCAAVETANHSQLAKETRLAAGEGKFQPAFLLKKLLNEDRQYLEKTARDLELDAPLLQVIGLNCLRPFLFHWAGGLALWVDLSTWQSGFCPFCGHAPIFAELRGPQRARRLRCGLCGADWPFNRLECAGCGNINPQTLALLQIEGEPETLAVQTCDACYTYVKMIVTLEPLDPYLLLLADLSTMALDLIAENHGYQRPG